MAKDPCDTDPGHQRLTSPGTEKPTVNECFYLPFAHISDNFTIISWKVRNYRKRRRGAGAIKLQITESYRRRNSTQSVSRLLTPKVHWKVESFTSLSHRQSSLNRVIKLCSGLIRQSLYCSRTGSWYGSSERPAELSGGGAFVWARSTLDYVRFTWIQTFQQERNVYRRLLVVKIVAFIKSNLIVSSCT